MEGTDRVDIIETPATTMVYDINEGLPYESKIFDKVICRNVLEHIKDIGTLADEIYRVMKPGATLYLTTDNAAYIAFHALKSHEHNAFLQNQYKSHDYKHDYDTDRHYHLFVHSNLFYLFKKFRNHKFGYIYGGRNKIVHQLIKLIPFKMGAISVTMECVK